MEKPIYPCLWFEKEARKAAEHYCSLFPGSKMTEHNTFVTTFEIGGTKMMALNGGPMYKINSAVSLFVYCGGNDEIERLYNVLSEGGSIVMPLGKYEWTEKYAWVVDSFGVNWQLDVDPINSSQKIVPTLLFANQKYKMVKEALSHYTHIFTESRILLEAPYPKTELTNNGELLFAQFKLSGYIFNAMSSTMVHDFDFSPATSFVVECETQEEIDYYWEKLGDGGAYSMCGWLEDKFGVSWQIIPRFLIDLVSNPEKSEKVFQAFANIQKFDISELKRL